MKPSDTDPNLIAKRLTALLKRNGIYNYKIVKLELAELRPRALMRESLPESTCLVEVSPGVKEWRNC